MSVNAAHAATVRSGIRAEIVTIVWMAIEAVVAVVAGVRAHSVLVTAFGIERVNEGQRGAVGRGRRAKE